MQCDIAWFNSTAITQCTVYSIHLQNVHSVAFFSVAFFMSAGVACTCHTIHHARVLADASVVSGSLMPRISVDMNRVRHLIFSATLVHVSIVDT